MLLSGGAHPKFMILKSTMNQEEGLKVFLFSMKAALTSFPVCGFKLHSCFLFPLINTVAFSF